MMLVFCVTETHYRSVLNFVSDKITSFVLCMHAYILFYRFVVHVFLVMLLCMCSVSLCCIAGLVIYRVRPIPVSGIGYRPILILVSAPIPVVHLPVSTVNTVARTPIVSSL